MTRLGIAGLMSAASVKLLSRKDTDEQPCVDPKGRLGCGNCSVLSKCGLPRGRSFKQFLSRKNG